MVSFSETGQKLQVDHAHKSVIYLLIELTYKLNNEDHKHVMDRISIYSNSLQFGLDQSGII